MFIPFLTPASRKSTSRRAGPRRSVVVGRGGSSGSSGGEEGGEGGEDGGEEGGGSSSSGSGGSGSSGSSGSKGGSSSDEETSSVSGIDEPASTYGNGGGKVSTVRAGKPFAGRAIGGAIRKEIFGNMSYGSGYPNDTGPGVSGRGFPFYFWPIVWGDAAGPGTDQIYQVTEYGSPSNTSRPGGPEAEAAFTSNSTGTVFRFLSDNYTVSALIPILNSSCYAQLTSNTSTIPSPFGQSSPDIRPEEAIQYYRASSAVLFLEGYNNSVVFSNDTSQVDTPLPSNIDTNLLSCLNQTIGQAVPLVNDAYARWSAPNIGALGLAWFFWVLVSHQL